MGHLRLIQIIALVVAMGGIVLAGEDRILSRVSRFIGYEKQTGPHPTVVEIYNFGEFLCSGSAINPFIVLTTAHCLSGIFLAGLIVKLKEYKSFVTTVKRMEIHDDYNSVTYDKDAGLIQLKDKLPQFHNSYFVNLKKDTGMDDAITTAHFWIHVKSGALGDKTMELRNSDVRIIPNTECTRKWNNSFTLQSIKGQACGEEIKPDHSVIYLGAGGPVMGPGTYQWGIVSTPRRCGWNVPDIYVKISEVYDWIMKTTADMENEIPHEQHTIHPLSKEEIDFYKKEYGDLVYEWEADFLVSIVDAKTRKAKCVGALLDDDLIVTTSKDCADAGKSNIMVTMDRLKTKKTIPVSSIKKHPKYDPNDRTNRFNLAILHLQQKIEFNEYSNKTKLAEKKPSAGSLAKIYGYNLHMKTRSLKLSVSHNEECELFISPNVKNEQGRICAKSRVGMCPFHKPFGAPLMVNRSLVGLMSIEPTECADYRAPVVFTDLTMDENKKFVEKWLHHDWHNDGDL
ncbi:hypothetical protein QAD02_009335 [Eretmocerus hayati]|uniref:Uncharacterized protein n=1 Tax=Eretmocerus hayati TaxID=131215 RepID=A0ACC2N9B1_9HYME|nr:hypothetical protein QAD02_009335 [Eretmocerus hayati]